MTVLTDHLPLLASAPNGIKKLRELILELAVRGKLVPQDPSDEPASELLRQIAENKERLRSSGKLKRQKSLAQVDSSEEPFEVPRGWEWVRLGEISNFGITSKVASIPDDAWLLDLEDVEKDSSRLIQRKLFSERRSLSDKNSFLKGDVLYGKLRPYLNKVLVSDDDGFCTTEILPFRCHGPFNAHFFKFALMSPYFLSYVNAKSYGMKMPRLGTEDGRQALVPLAPLAEQSRIVAKIDELMALCDTLETQQTNAESAYARLVQALLDSLTYASDADDFASSWQRLSKHFDTLFTTEASIDALKQTVLQLAVMGKLVRQDPGDEPASDLLIRIQSDRKLSIACGRSKPQRDTTDLDLADASTEIPDSWSWIKFDDLIDPEFPIAYGVLVPGPNVKNGIPFVRIADLDLVDPPRTPEKFISIDVDEKFQRTRLHGGEILMGVVGSIGKLGIAPPSWAGANIARAICRIVPSPQVSRSYVIWLLQSVQMRHRFLGDVRRLAQPTLNIGLIRSALTPLPPFKEQARIASKLDELMSLCDQLKSRIRQERDLSQQLASSLVERAVA